MPFPGICRSQFAFLIFLGHPDIKKWKLRYKRACKKSKYLVKKKSIGEKMINYQFKRTSLNKVQLSRFFYSHWLLSEDFFSFLIKAFVKSEKLIRFHHQASITATDFGACAPHPLNFEQQNFFLQFLLITSWVTSVLKM